MSSEEQRKRVQENVKEAMRMSEEADARDAAKWKAEHPEYYTPEAIAKRESDRIARLKARGKYDPAAEKAAAESYAAAEKASGSAPKPIPAKKAPKPKPKEKSPAEKFAESVAATKKAMDEAEAKARPAAGLAGPPPEVPKGPPKAKAPGRSSSLHPGSPSTERSSPEFLSEHEEEKEKEGSYMFRPPRYYETDNTSDEAACTVSSSDTEERLSRASFRDAQKDVQDDPEAFPTDSEQRTTSGDDENPYICWLGFGELLPRAPVAYKWEAMNLSRFRGRKEKHAYKLVRDGELAAPTPGCDYDLETEQYALWAEDLVSDSSYDEEDRYQKASAALTRSSRSGRVLGEATPGGEVPPVVATEAAKEAKAPGSSSAPPPEGKARPSTQRTGLGAPGSAASSSAGPSGPSQAQAGRRPGPTRLGAPYIPRNDTDRGGSWSNTKWKDSSRWTRESEWGARAARDSHRADHHGWDAKKGKGKGMRCERDSGILGSGPDLCNLALSRGLGAPWPGPGACLELKWAP